jgi:hypothetical protein
MKRILMLLLLSIFTSNISSQTLEETIDWIYRNGKGRETVNYDYSTKKLQIISFRGDDWTSVEEFDPKDIKSVKIDYKKENWNSIQLHFDLSKDIYYSTFSLDSDFKEETGTRKRYKNGRAYIDLYLNADREKIKQFKNAFLNIFKKLGININDDENMFKN